MSYLEKFDGNGAGYPKGFGDNELVGWCYGDGEGSGWGAYNGACLGADWNWCNDDGEGSRRSDGEFDSDGECFGEGCGDGEGHNDGNIWGMGSGDGEDASCGPGRG